LPSPLLEVKLYQTGNIK